MKAPLRAIFIAILISMVVCSVVFVGTVEAKRAIDVVSQFDGETLKQRFSTGTNYAIVIGINSYRHHPNLKTAVNDAEAVAGLLDEKYFFNHENIFLIKDTDATKERIMRVFRDLVATKVKKGDNVFIYYAGHGWYDDILKSGYWVTTEATESPATFLDNNTIYKVIAALDDRGVQHVLLVSDSCFSGAFTKEHRAIETTIDDRYFREKYTKPSRNVLTSGGIEPVEDVGKGGHSIFAYYFLKTLKDNPYPYLSAKQLGVQVEELVTRNSTQTPLSRFIHGVGDEGGQFFFINKTSPPGSEAEKVLTIEPKRPPQALIQKPKDELELALAKLKEQQEAKKREKAALKQTFMQLIDDVKKYEKIESSGLDKETKLAAWKAFERKYAQWSAGVAPGDINSILDNALTVDSDGSLTEMALDEGLRPPVINSIGMKFVLIPAGTFTMGSPTDELGHDNDETQHRVTLSKGFYMQTTEITQGQWRAIMGTNPSYFKNCDDNCPVEEVSWNDVQDFIRRLNQKEGMNKYRLSTEAEWEYACQAGSTKAFANGDITELKCGYDQNLDAMGWYCGNSRGKTHPVAQKDPNAWGLYDMHGNVWEWCEDWYGDYPTGSVTDPKGPSSGTSRVSRGGSWNLNAGRCRSANRSGGTPSYRNHGNGFRLAPPLGQGLPPGWSGSTDTEDQSEGGMKGLSPGCAQSELSE